MPEEDALSTPILRGEGGRVNVQYDSPEQQQTTAVTGLWVFLGTEVMFFGALLLAFIVYRSVYPQAFAEGTEHQNVLIGSINTIVLTTSSLILRLAVRGAQLGHKWRLVFYLSFAITLGVLFEVLKGTEYYQHYEESLIPGPGFKFPEPFAAQAQIYWLLYFISTGLHALHLLIGIGVMNVMLFFTLRNKFGPNYYTPIEISANYWHFVDIVWTVLFPVIYLLRWA